VFITDRSIIESVFFSETETDHELESVSDKIRFKIISIFLQELNQLTAGQVLFGLQKNFKNTESVFKIIYVFLFEKLFEACEYVSYKFLTKIYPDLLYSIIAASDKIF